MSRNRKRAQVKLQRVHDRIANQRKDFLHKLSYGLVQAYDLICIEELSVQGMMKNHRLAKSIANASLHHSPGCGIRLDRDENAARNILKRGLERIA